MENRWTLYYHALDLGITPRRGGYSVQHLVDYIKEHIIEISEIDPITAPSRQFFLAVAKAEAEEDKKVLIDWRQTLKTHPKFNRSFGVLSIRFRACKKAIQRLDWADVRAGIISGRNPETRPSRSSDAARKQRWRANKRWDNRLKKYV